MTYKVKITPTAILELKNSINYYNTQKDRLGKQFKNIVDTTIEK